MTALDHMWERREGNGGGNEERSKSCRFLEFLVGWKYNIYVSTSITSYRTFTPDVAISLICNCIWLLSLVLKLFDDGIPGVECVFNRESLKRSFRLLGTFFWRQKLLSPSRRYCPMSPAGRQSLQFYNDLIKWWLIPGEPIANDTIQLTCHNSCNHLTRRNSHKSMQLTQLITTRTKYATPCDQLRFPIHPSQCNLSHYLDSLPRALTQLPTYPDVLFISIQHNFELIWGIVSKLKLSQNFW